MNNRLKKQSEILQVGSHQDTLSSFTVLSVNESELITITVRWCEVWRTSGTVSKSGHEEFNLSGTPRVE